MEWFHYLYYAFAAAYLFVVPALVLGKVLYPAQTRTLRFGIGLAIMASVLPTGAFALAMLLHTVVSAAMLYGLATVIMAVGMLVQLVRLRRRTQALED